MTLFLVVVVVVVVYFNFFNFFFCGEGGGGCSQDHLEIGDQLSKKWILFPAYRLDWHI